MPPGVHMAVSELVCGILADAGGELPRAEVARRLAPRIGVHRTRLALGLAIIGGRVVLDHDDVMRLASEDPRGD